MSAKQSTRERQDGQRAAKLAAGASPAATEFLLVRHGETAFNSAGRLQGAAPPGPPLNEHGWQQARALGAALAAAATAAPEAAAAGPAAQQPIPGLAAAGSVVDSGGRGGGGGAFDRRPFDRVYSSDLLRAVQTAEVLAEALGLGPGRRHQHPGLRERDVGAHLAGLLRSEAPARAPEAWAALGSRDAAQTLPGGGESIEQLQARVSSALVDIARRHPGERILLVSHGGALHSIHRRSRGYMAPGRVGNCAVSRLLVDPGDDGTSLSSSTGLSPSAATAAAAATAGAGGGGTAAEAAEAEAAAGAGQEGSGACSADQQQQNGDVAASWEAGQQQQQQQQQQGSNWLRQRQMRAAVFALLTWNDSAWAEGAGILDAAAASFGGGAREG